MCGALSRRPFKQAVLGGGQQVCACEPLQNSEKFPTLSPTLLGRIVGMGATLLALLALTAVCWPADAFTPRSLPVRGGPLSFRPLMSVAQQGGKSADYVQRCMSAARIAVLSVVFSLAPGRASGAMSSAEAQTSTVEKHRLLSFLPWPPVKLKVVCEDAPYLLRVEKAPDPTPTSEGQRKAKAVAVGVSSLAGASAVAVGARVVSQREERLRIEKEERRRLAAAGFYPAQQAEAAAAAAAAAATAESRKQDERAARERNESAAAAVAQAADAREAAAREAQEIIHRMQEDEDCSVTLSRRDSGSTRTLVSPQYVATSAGAPCEATAAAEKLNGWLRDRGELPAVGGCAVAVGSWGLGLRAREALGAGDVAVEVGAESIISEATWADGMDPEAAQLVQSVVYDAWGWGGRGGVLEAGDVLLAVRLLHERALGAASAFAPYMDALPADVSGAPVQWEPQEIQALLAGMLMADDALALHNSMQEAFALLRSLCFQAMPVAFPPTVFSRAAFCWAIGTVLSRAIPASAIAGVDAGRGLMLVPGLDCANHDDSVRLQFAAGARGGVALLADRAIAPGEEVFTTYGPKSNAQMFMSMGFCRSDAHHAFNSADLLLMLNAGGVSVVGGTSDDLRQEKFAALQRAGLAPTMRFRVPASETLLRRGLAARAPRTNHPGMPVRHESGVEEVLASWEQVLPFVRLSLLTLDDAVMLGIRPGLKWQTIGATPPATGRKLTNVKLANVLKRRAELSAQEWAAVGIEEELLPDDYIKAGTTYFSPAAADSGGLWEKMWQPWDDAGEGRVLEYLMAHLEKMLAGLELPVCLSVGVAAEGRKQEEAGVVREAEATAVRNALRVLSSFPS